VNETLWELYAEVCEDEYRPLEEFVDRLIAGEWGTFPTEDVLELLRELEGRVLSNIQIKAQEGPVYSSRADEVAERTHAEFIALAERVERGRTDPAT
jgi:hypothetical protein